MTAAPEPRARLALVDIHLAFPVVVAPRRSGTVTLGDVPRGPTHHLAYHRRIRPANHYLMSPKRSKNLCAALSFLFNAPLRDVPLQ